MIEKVAGQSYEEVLQQQIFTPLGMRDSGYDYPQTILRLPDDRVTIIVLANIENISIGPDLLHIVFSGAAPR